MKISPKGGDDVSKALVVIHGDINHSKSRHSRGSGNPGRNWIPPDQVRGRLSQARNDKLEKTYVVMYNISISTEYESV